VLGLYMMALGVLYPVGAVVEGAIAHAVGIREVTVASGLVLFAVMVAVAVWRGHLLTALGDAVALSGGPVDLVAGPAVPVAPTPPASL
jgi:hypothetical protein